MMYQVVMVLGLLGMGLVGLYFKIDGAGIVLGLGVLSLFTMKWG